jgi:hypothetical protein
MPTTPPRLLGSYATPATPAYRTGQRVVCALRGEVEVVGLSAFHGDEQRLGLPALLDEVGLARSLLAYELPDGRLQLIDGHLRREELGDQEVTVEVLDVTEEEARKLLLAMDPLAALADFHEQKVAELQAVVTTRDEILAGILARVGQRHAAAVEEVKRATKKPEPAAAAELDERYLVVIECADEERQREALRWCKARGYDAKAVLS